MYIIIMSNSINQLSTVAVVSDKIQQPMSVFTIRKGVSNNNYTTLNITGSPSNNSLSYTFTVPDVKTFISKLWCHQWTIQVDATSLDTGKTCVSYGLYDGLRAYPINSIIDNQSLQICNQTVSNNNSEYFHGVTWYVDQRLKDKQNSMAPTFPDMYQEYTDGVLSNKSPFSTFNDQSTILQNGRCSIQPDPWAAAVNTNVAYSQRFTLQEPVMISPLGMDGDAYALVGLQQVALNFNYNTINNMWSHDAVNGNTFTSFQVTLVSAQLNLQYLTMSPLMTQSDRNIYPYTYIDRYLTSVGTIPYSATTISTSTVNMSAVTLSSVPDHIYVFVGENFNNKTYSSCDSFAQIRNINISFGQDNNILSNATPFDLFRIACSNGYSGDWHTWNSNGSVLKLVFNKDICLPSQLDLSAGVAGAFSMQVSLQVRNINVTRQNISYMAYLVVINNGTFSIFDGQSVIEKGFVSKQDVLDTATLPVELNEGDVKDAVGGALLGGCCGGVVNLSKILKGVSSATKYGSEIADDLGLGKRGKGGCKEINGQWGGKKLMRGGAILSSDDLKNRAMKKNI